MDSRDDALLGSNDRKSGLSIAYVNAVAAAAGYTASVPSLDRDSIDLKIDAGGPMFPRLELQLKATSGLSWSGGQASYRLGRKNYDDLRLPRSTPAILVVVEMPDEEAKWAEFGTEGLTLRRCAWWISLLGEPELDQQTRTVRLMEDQRFEPESLRGLMDRVRGGAA